MTRILSVAAALILLGICVGRGASQNAQPKDVKQPAAKPVPEVDTTQDDLKVLREGGLKGDGPDLLEYFRKRTYKQPDPKEIESLIRQLGDEDFATREKAFTALVAMGASVTAGIKLGENDPDLEVRKRISDLKERIDSKTEPILQVAAAHALARQKLPGTADVVLAFLPFATDTMVVDELCKTLGAVALNKDKVESVLLKSLEDAIAVKRGAAGEALIRAGAKDDLPAVKKLLKDADPTVRLRISLAMLPLGDKEILPVMVDLLGELPPSQLWPIEEALLRLAGDKAPAVSLGSDPSARKTCRDAWSKWLTDNAKTVDMAKLVQDNVLLGYTMVVLQNNIIAPGRNATGEIFELDVKNNVRWKFEVPTYPVDAQVISGNRVLVAEYQGGRVTERDLKGEIKWEYACGGNPFAVQRLPNGNTFIAMQSRLVEIDRNKNEVWSYQRPQHDIIRARRLPTGEVALVTNLGNNSNYIRMEPKTQKVNKSFNISPVQMLFGNFDVLPNGHIVVPHYNQHKVVEYDENGKQVGNPIMNQQWSNSVVRLPNHHNLITSYNLRRVVELDQNNNPVMTYQANGTVFVARRR